MEAARVLGRKKMREGSGGGGQGQGLGEWGRRPRQLHKGGGVLGGRAARVKGRLMGWIKVQGPNCPRDSSRPYHKQLTKEILLSYR
jgi:hypothetical protein